MLQIINNLLKALLLVGLSCAGLVQAASLNDPTRPAVMPSAEPAGTVTVKKSRSGLTSIISGKRPVAIINNEIKSVGDSINGSKVVAIKPTQVILANGKKIKMYQSVASAEGRY
ncbi:MSHA biogenesis protein MshK [Parashewanella curva]|uniref:MSHA biogenesis protein MshK n=1 Tax=Parashewanella curva TaxID=2338552 RepID=A0A3L8PUP8_9GAMM|nr:MSHA biogenesis protein MshK [Parashewanella curva]RLV59050.1 MSHA biogenesis protein MshK [Parashewanella curva]